MKCSIAAFLLLFGCLAGHLYAQVEVDKKIDLTGPDGERMVTNLEAPVNPTDAVNKAYVDAAVAAGGGGDSFTMLSNESPSAVTFINALTYCRNLTESTFSDWQLPTGEQLFTLLSKGGTGLTITNPTSSNFFWFQPAQGTSAASMSIMRFSDGYVTTNSFSSPANTYHVRCVR